MDQEVRSVKERREERMVQVVENSQDCLPQCWVVEWLLLRILRGAESNSEVVYQACNEARRTGRTVMLERKSIEIKFEVFVEDLLFAPESKL